MNPQMNPAAGWQQPPNAFNGAPVMPGNNLAHQMSQMGLGAPPPTQQMMPPTQQFPGAPPMMASDPNMMKPPQAMPMGPGAPPSDALSVGAPAMPPSVGQMPPQRQPLPMQNGNPGYNQQPQQPPQQYGVPPSVAGPPAPAVQPPSNNMPPQMVGQGDMQAPPPQIQNGMSGPPQQPPLGMNNNMGPSMPPPMNTQYPNPTVNGPPGGPMPTTGLPPSAMPPSQQPMARPGVGQQPPHMPPGSQMPPSMPGQMQNRMPPMPGQLQQHNQMPGMMPGQMPPPGPMPGQMPPGGQMSGQMPPPGQMPGQMHMPGQMAGQMPPPGQMSGQMPPQPNYPGYNQQGQQPMYNQQRMAPGGYPQAPEQSQRRLDPDLMPNPIIEMFDNQTAWTDRPFETNRPGLVPPLVTTKFITQDQGNSGPRFIRSTMYSIPTTADVMKQTAMPFALIISPFARTVEGEVTPPIVDFGEMGPIRCLRCKAYMSPHMQFIDGGRRFQCLLCKQTTEVPAEYFQHLDHTGQRVDKYQRPELVLGTYEFVATKDYCRNNKPPQVPAIVFVIDVSYNNVKSGLVHLMCREMKEILKHLAMDQGHTRSYMRVGFITYNNTVHFYNCKSTLAQPQMMIVGDLQEMFMPLLDGFLVDPVESSAVIDSLMEQIPAMFNDTRETETILLPAIQAGLEALRASETVGKLLVFQSSLPIAEAPGKLKNREDRKLLGTEKERTILGPQSNVYNNLGQDCVQAGCSVDLFLFNNSYIDIATIGQVSRLTGGEIYKYTYFQADIDGQRVITDVIKNVSRPTAFDSVMRVRTSTGIRPTDFYGHFFMSNTTDMEIAGIDCDKSVAIEIKHDDKLQEESIHVQVALLYTSCSGQRRLRVMNLALNTCVQVTDLYRGCDIDATVLFFGKQAMFKLLENPPKVVKDNLLNRSVQILASYRKHCASPAAPGQLILPDSMKLLPLYTATLLKNDAVSGGSDMACDDRSFVMHYVMCMDLPSSVSYFYPKLIPIHNVSAEETNIPAQIRCTAEKFTDDGAFILENGVYMFIWLGLGLSPEFTQAVFGAPTAQQIDTERFGLPVFDNPLSQRVRDIVDRIQMGKHRCMRVTFVRQRDKLENVMRHFLVEDRGTDGTSSYVDFLCHLHKEIRTFMR